ncbi:hypothetical protein AOX55_00006646 (plasmid) [Sinorhizobium fredii CCBAU 25509]|nr:hypothetical protein AOX55_00006646 [Sinorhizobium fredii CCBAU 25509]
MYRSCPTSINPADMRSDLESIMVPPLNFGRAVYTFVVIFT